MDHKVKYDSDSIKRVDTVCFLLKEFDVYHTGYFYPPKKTCQVHLHVHVRNNSCLGLIFEIFRAPVYSINYISAHNNPLINH